MNQTQYFIGVDGGGTRTTCVLARNDGTVLKRSIGEGINFNNIGMEEARKRLHKAVTKLLEGTDVSFDCICIGMSALDYAADEETTRLFAGDLFDPDKMDMQSDAYTALMGYTLGQSGMIIICGTGSMLLMVDGKGNQQVTGGWGHILGDPGSSHALAMDGLRAAINHWEGVSQAPRLAEKAMEHFKLSYPRQLIERVFDPACSPATIAQFAKEVLILAAEGDACAYDIVFRNMDHTAAEAAALLIHAPEAARVGLHGGVFTHNPLACELFTQALQARIPHAVTGMAEYPPELGALIHVFAKRGLVTDSVLHTLKESYAAI
ncbi:MAG: hypothetical protein IKT57_03765 [Clostridia bacterium]|nr:hypothetical protein [Clostridia bacterium]